MNTRDIFKKNLNRFIEQSGKNKKMISEEMNIPYTTLAEWANGNKFPRADGIEKLANYFKILKSDLLEEPGTTDDIYKDDIYKYENIIPIPNTKKVPLVGTIPCGEPILAVENIECEVEMPENIHADFALRCKGDSMIDAHIYDGDIVYIRQQPIVDNGEIAAVLICEEATLKRFYRNGDTVTLMPCNPKFNPFVYKGEQLNDMRILGKAVGFTSTNI